MSAGLAINITYDQSTDNLDRMSPTSTDSHASSASTSSTYWSLQKLLECTTCHRLLSPPILICESGHNICSACQKSGSGDSGDAEIGTGTENPNCFQCNAPVTTTTRNLLLEQILGQLKGPCLNSKDGCKELVNISNWSEHEKNCSFREVICNIKEKQACVRNKMPCSSYFNHIKKVHGVTGVSGVLNIMQNTSREGANLINPIPWDKWPMHYIESFEHVFLIGTEIQNGRIAWWISIIGSDKEGSDYIGTITLNNKIKDITLSWSGPIRSFRTNLNDILSTGTLNTSAKDFELFLTPLELPKPVKEGQEVVCWYISFSVSKRIIPPFPSNPVQIQKPFPVPGSGTNTLK